MSARLKGKKAPTKEARRILLRQIDKALPVSHQARAADSQIHDARKQLKKARATLRILRKALSRSQYEAENACLRDAARPLSKVRDTAVLQQTFNGLLEKSPGASRARSARRFGQQLAKDHSQARSAVTRKNGLPHVRQLLQGARAQAERWSVAGKGWSVIGAGLKKVYGQARDALDAVRAEPSDASFHEWRKQTKYLRYEVGLLQAMQPRQIEALEKELHRLSDCLGDDHDLAVLRQRLASQHQLFADEGSRRRLDEKITGRRAALQRDALRLGKRVYKEPPKKFHNRLHGYWRDWRRHAH